MAATARTPRVQLVLNLQHDAPQEQILRVTAGHEVVEARHAGVAFQFSRKRRITLADHAGAPRPAPSTHTQRASLYRTPAAARALPAPTAAATAVKADSPYADELEVPRAVGERLLEGLQALPDRAPPADRLLAICSSLCAAAVEAAERPQRLRSRLGPIAAEAGSREGSARAAALADALSAFQASLAAALADGSVALAGPAALRAPATPAEEGEVEQAAPGYQVDLAARKAGLRARLANFQREEEEWHSLLQKVEQLDQQQLGAGAAAAASQPGAAGTGEAAAAGAEAGGSAGQELSSVATDPGAYWPQQAAAQQDGAAAAAHAGSSGSGADGEGAEEGGPELEALARLHRGVHRHLAMQVEGVCKLVGDVEELVERANRAAAAVQAEYHAEKFRPFPHVNSPARLIRELVRLPGSAAGAGPAAEADAGAGKAAAAQQQAAADGKENAAAIGTS